MPDDKKPAADVSKIAKKRAPIEHSQKGNAVLFMEHSEDDKRPAIKVGDWQAIEFEAAGYIETEEAEARHAKQCADQAAIDLKRHLAAQEEVVRKKLLSGGR